MPVSSCISLGASAAYPVALPHGCMCKLLASAGGDVACRSDRKAKHALSQPACKLLVCSVKAKAGNNVRGFNHS